VRRRWITLAVVFLTRLSMGFQLGFIRDRSGSPAAPVFFAAGLMAPTVLGLGAFRLVKGRGPAGARE
jgi:hypothetical protein